MGGWFQAIPQLCQQSVISRCSLDLGDSFSGIENSRRSPKKLCLTLAIQRSNQNIIHGSQCIHLKMDTHKPTLPLRGTQGNIGSHVLQVFWVKLCPEHISLEPSTFKAIKSGDFTRLLIGIVSYEKMFWMVAFKCTYYPPLQQKRCVGYVLCWCEIRHQPWPWVLPFWRSCFQDNPQYKSSG